MIRAIALSLVLLLGVGVVIPLVTEFAEAGPKKQRKYAKKKKKIKKYSKQWWRLYHARMKRKKALQARKRALRLRQIRLANMRRPASSNKPAKAQVPVQKATKTETAPSVLPNGESAPKTWKRSQASQNELQFRVDDENGAALGSASISVVGPSMAADDNPKAKSVGGVPTTSLRRNVIDQMIRENGWVVNDFQKEVAGKKVYVVVAQSEVKGGPVQSRIFYFAEVDGRIYSVATNSAADTTERIAAESEKVLMMLARRRDPQQAGLR